jgi:gamma-glutamylcyclotransferase (GGCT)/AIG2-like uncharacterized protein YtfP
MANEYLFVYGTLLDEVDHPMGKFLRQHARMLGPAKMSGQLFYIDRYPGLLIHKNRSGTYIQGQVYKLAHPGQVLKVLDDYEECGDHMRRIAEYRRERHIVQLQRGGSILAWVYVYRHCLRKRLPIIHGDYLRFKGRTLQDKTLRRGEMCHQLKGGET